MGGREAWGGGAWAALGSRSSPQPVKACYTISPDSLPGPGEPPTIPVGKAGIWGTGRRGVWGGRLKPIPLKGTSTLYTCPQPPTHPHQEYPSGGQPQGRVRGEGVEEREKILEEEGLHSLAHSLCATAFPTHCSIATAILGAGGLGKRQGVEATGASVSPERWGADGTAGGRRVEVLSLSLFPCRLSPVPAAHRILKAHGPQTSSHLLYPDLTLHTEQREASEDGQHSPLSPWPGELSGSGLSHSHRRARIKKTPRLAPRSNCTTTAAAERGHFL